MIFIYALLLLNTFCFAKNLDTIALECNTDKSSAFHSYANIYERYLNPISQNPVKLLEIGFACGYSALLWDRYFTHPESKFYFLDINRDCYNHMEKLSNRCTLNMVNQASTIELMQWIKVIGSEFDIIIDDGSHQMEHIVTSFKTLFPHLKKGGIYIIEDLHTSYWSDYGSAGDYNNPLASPNSAIRFFQSLVDEMNYSGARTQSANRSHNVKSLQSLNLYQESIAAIHFYCSLCIILKD